VLLIGFRFRTSLNRDSWCGDELSSGLDAG
jgi:hypothetical protein